MHTATPIIAVSIVHALITAAHLCIPSWSPLSLQAAISLTPLNDSPMPVACDIKITVVLSSDIIPIPSVPSNRAVILLRITPVNTLNPWILLNIPMYFIICLYI